MTTPTTSAITATCPKDDRVVSKLKAHNDCLVRNMSTTYVTQDQRQAPADSMQQCLLPVPPMGDEAQLVSKLIEAWLGGSWFRHLCHCLVVWFLGSGALQLSQLPTTQYSELCIRSNYGRCAFY